MIKWIPKYWKSILFLLIITPILTELLTNNIPSRRFFDLKLFLILATLGYGPVLLLRELAVRWRLGIVGYIILGLVYGLYNEGLLAKTIFQAQVPNPIFNGYGVAFSINFTWTTIILIFHAFYAFLFPILFVYAIFPSSATKPWINRKVWLLISAGFFIYISNTFLSKLIKPVTSLHFILLIIFMVLLSLMAHYFRDRKMFGTEKPKYLLLLFGFLFVVTVFVLTDIIVKAGLHPVLYILYLLAILSGTILILQGRSIASLLLFALTAEITFAACEILVAKMKNSVSQMETEVGFVVIFVIALIMVFIRQSKLTYDRIGQDD